MTSAKENQRLSNSSRPDSSTGTRSSAKQEGIRTDVQQSMKQRPLIERMQRKLKQAK